MQKLRAWIESSNTLCLDLRSKLDFKSCHLKYSTNIPVAQLAVRQSELPPKQLPFAVIEPINAKGCSSWLSEHGWKNTPWIIWEGDVNWKDLARHECTATEKDKNKKNILFKPSPFLESHMDLIEASLKQDGKETWECLDIGCGAGRDVGYVLARDNEKWRASAFDFLPGAMVRTDMLVRNLDVGQYMNTCAQAELLPDGQWKLISDAWWIMNDRAGMQDLKTAERADEITRRLASTSFIADETTAMTFQDFYKQLLPTKKPSFDLILNIRFLSRPFLLQVPELLNVGGFFVISHFVHDGRYDYKQPKRSLRLELNEISELYSSMNNMEVIKDIIEEIEDGRPINSIIVRKCK